MLKLASFALLIMLAASVMASGPGMVETFNNAALMDATCAERGDVDPGEHTRACALQCQMNGFGIVTPESKFLKFDDAGNSQIIAQLKKSPKKDHLRVNVAGEVKGGTLKVKSVSLL